MKTIEKQSEVLNDLIRINNDRTEGYEKAATEAEDHPDLVSLFKTLASDSIRFATNLKSFVGADETDDTTPSGKVYRIWMEMKTSFSDSRKSLLDLCEFGEDAALKTYDQALKDAGELSPEVAQAIRSQRADIKMAHDRIKIMRDMASKG